MHYSFFRTFAAGFFMLITILSVTGQAQDQIKLKKKFLSSVKYTVGDKSPQDIYTFTGMDAKPHFKKLIGRYPEAVKEIKTSFTYNGVALLGNLVMLSGSVLMLSNTLQEAKDLSNGNFSSKSDDSTPLQLIVGGAVISLVGGMLANSHLKKGIRIFNENEKQAAGSQKASGLNIRLQPQIGKNQAGLSLVLNWN